MQLPFRNSRLGSGFPLTFRLNQELIQNRPPASLGSTREAASPGIGKPVCVLLLVGFLVLFSIPWAGIASQWLEDRAGGKSP